jgi:hypothetical protein
VARDDKIQRGVVGSPGDLPIARWLGERVEMVEPIQSESHGQCSAYV